MTEVEARAGADSANGSGPKGRPLEDRLRDHASIERLTDEVIPALIAKLSASALGEIEVREDEWKIRLRRPADAAGPPYGRRSTDRPSRAQPGHAGHGHAPGAVERAAHDGRDDGGTSAGDASTSAGRGARAASTSSVPGSNGAHHRLTAVGPGPDPGARVGRMGHIPDIDEPPAGARAASSGSSRAVATSPAVGIFQGRGEGKPGTRVRAGDRLAIVDVLGVPQPVLAPVDGLVGATLVENGDPVEYGQELIRIELAIPQPAAREPGASSEPGPMPAPGGASGSGLAGAGADEVPAAAATSDLRVDATPPSATAAGQQSDVAPAAPTTDEAAAAVESSATPGSPVGTPMGGDA